MTENEIIAAAQLDDRRDQRDQRNQRSTLKAKHAARLTQLMEARADLRGVNALADHLDDAIRWTA